MTTRHFLSLTDITPAEFRQLLERAIVLKKIRRERQPYNAFHGRVVILMFEKSSTRTRVSFEAAVAEGGGSTLFLSPRDIQIGRGETVEDTARVLSRMSSALVLRTFSHTTQQIFASHSTVPVVNGLSDTEHPCQLLADMQTYFEHRGDIAGKTVVWVGDGNNMCNSYIDAARMLGFKLRIACPQGYEPTAPVKAGDAIDITHDPAAAAAGADLIVTDVWTSMGQEEEQRAREVAFADFQVTSAMMAKANSDALFMHCLPAHRGEEVAADVIDGPRSVVWDEAENRLHAQKALLEMLLQHE